MKIKKKSGQKIEKKLGLPLAFSKILTKNFFSEFLLLDSWNCMWRTKNDVSRRWLPA